MYRAIFQLMNLRADSLTAPDNSLDPAVFAAAETQLSWLQFFYLLSADSMKNRHWRQTSDAVCGCHDFLKASNLANKACHAGRCGTHVVTEKKFFLQPHKWHIIACWFALACQILPLFVCKGSSRYGSGHMFGHNHYFLCSNNRMCGTNNDLSSTRKYLVHQSLGDCWRAHTGEAPS
jgi:hypothetical protein